MAGDFEAHDKLTCEHCTSASFVFVLYKKATFKADCVRKIRQNKKNNIKVSTHFRKASHTLGPRGNFHQSLCQKHSYKM